ncbi:CBS domain-containing protein [Subsaximicrobium wynnwilliamsii]|jgi:CBS domain-containing protein|uniref:CBS domain-containing protein n=1 Tax=Subsaximicrobium wynnwilliamsii TaxID=291179 RepID=A0A5C6ZJJ7_9FLAO|nr:CBS domain-containing protein [Subsaximicrobium wynnwilliamsii]TXD83066.1 CBS domain-containing protein [Subsaximicrobium wynnwilliamsii]TXD88810.1 CBS domain-containing protein [Subsaximicrobium wynnwilliamsii]TXE02883.1 CBS domain-containing protein [Subsaximicrobium wynnwilliamsii]
MNKSAIVKDIMTSRVITLPLNSTLEQAETVLKENKIKHIPIVHENKIVGILSHSDILRISVADAIEDENGDAHDIETTVYDMFTIHQVMAKTVATITPDTTVKEVAKILTAKEFNALPVIENDELVGIVTTTDLIKFLLNQL